MTTDLDYLLWGLEAETAEPSVIVDPALEAFCLMRTRAARGTKPPRSAGAGRVPLAAILRYIDQHDSGEEA